MKFRKAVRWLASTFGVTVLTPFLQAPATKLAEALRFDTTFSDRWGPLMQWLSDLAQNVWYVFAAGAVVGFAGGIWVDWFLRGESASPASESLPPVKALRSLVRLRFSGHPEQPEEIFKENLGTWFVYWSQEIKMSDQNGQPLFHLPPSWAIFLTYENPVDSNQITVNFTGGRPDRWQVRQHTSMSAVLTIDGTMPACEMEIITRS